MTDRVQTETHPLFAESESLSDSHYHESVWSINISVITLSDTEIVTIDSDLVY